MKRKWNLKNLRLNVAAAKSGKPWLLLPDELAGFKQESMRYPLPDSFEELQELANIPLNPNGQDYGTIYLRRAREVFMKIVTAKGKTIHDVESTANDAEVLKKQFERRVKALEADASAAVDKVKDKAKTAIASLADLFDLGRIGIEGQMRAHIEDSPWKGEKISAAAFRDCFSIVTKTVKGLGLATDQKDVAREVVFKELAESMRATQEAQAMAVDPKEPTH